MGHPVFAFWGDSVPTALPREESLKGNGPRLESACLSAKTSPVFHCLCDSKRLTSLSGSQLPHVFSREDKYYICEKLQLIRSLAKVRGHHFSDSTVAALGAHLVVSWFYLGWLEEPGVKIKSGTSDQRVEASASLQMPSGQGQTNSSSILRRQLPGMTSATVLSH